MLVAKMVSKYNNIGQISPIKKTNNYNKLSFCGENKHPVSTKFSAEKTFLLNDTFICKSKTQNYPFIKQIQEINSPEQKHNMIPSSPNRESEPEGYTVDSTGRITFQTRSSSQIEKKLISMRFKRDERLTNLLGRELTEDQLVALNKLINAKDEAHNPLYRTIKTLVDAIKVKDPRAIDAAIERRIPIPTKANLPLFIKYATAKTPDGKYKHTFERVELASKVIQGNEELFEKLDSLQSTNKHITTDYIRNLTTMSDGLPTKSFIMMLDNLENTEYSYEAFKRITKYVKNRNIPNEVFEKLASDFGFHPEMIETALIYRKSTSELELIKKISDVSPTLHSIASFVIDVHRSVRAFGEIPLWESRTHIAYALSHMEKAIKQYPQLASVLGFPSGQPSELIAKCYIEHLTKQAPKSSEAKIQLEIAKCVEKLSLETFGTSDIDSILDLHTICQDAENGEATFDDIWDISYCFEILDSKTGEEILKMPEFKSIAEAGGVSHWIVNQMRTVLRESNDLEIAELAPGFPVDYLLKPAMFNSIELLNTIIKEELNNCTIKEFTHKVSRIRYYFEDLDLETFPKLAEFSVIRSILDAGGLDGYIAFKQAKFIRVVNPITPKVNSPEQLENLYHTMEKELFVENLTKSLSNVDFNSKIFEHGLPMQYSRIEFMQDINKVISGLSEEEISVVTKYFEFEADIEVFHDDKREKRLVSFSNFPRPKDEQLPEGISAKAKAAIETLNPIMEKFIYENRVVLPQYPEAEQLINSIIKVLPEFITIIGKPQHGTHAHTVDVHSLKVLQDCIKNPAYKALSLDEQTILNLVALMHDFGKKEGVINDGHELLSAFYVRNIMEKLPLSDSLKEKIFNLTENHNWLKSVQYVGMKNLEEAQIKTIENLATTFRAINEFTMAKIFAEADLKGVSESFAQRHIKKLSPKNNFIEEIETQIRSINKTAIPLNISKIKPDATYQLIDGVKVIDLANNPDDALNCFYGIKTFDDLRLLTHMCSDFNQLETLKILCTNGNNGNLSTTLISNNCRRTYKNRPFGIVLDASPENILEAFYHNISSGCEKGKDELQTILVEGLYLEERRFISETIKKTLKLSDTQFVKLFEKWTKGKVTQEEYAAIKSATDNLFTNADIHNEIVVFNPRLKGLIAKVDNWEDVPTEMKDFARTNDIPIIIFGSKPLPIK